MPTFIGIFHINEQVKVMLSWLKHEKSLLPLGYMFLFLPKQSLKYRSFYKPHLDFRSTLEETPPGLTDTKYSLYLPTEYLLGVLCLYYSFLN